MEVKNGSVLICDTTSDFARWAETNSHVKPPCPAEWPWKPALFNSVLDQDALQCKQKMATGAG